MVMHCWRKGIKDFEYLESKNIFKHLLWLAQNPNFIKENKNQWHYKCGGVKEIYPLSFLAFHPKKEEEKGMG